MSGIRPFAETDIPAVVQLRRRAFAHSERLSTSDVANAFREIFFGSPWVDPELPSWVFEDSQSQIVGFIGVVPRPMKLGGERLRAAVSTQLMVDPSVRGLPGAALLRRFLDGPQDLSLADNANDVARRNWEALGGRTSQLRSLTWNVPLRPAAFTASLWLDPYLPRGVARALRPLWSALDRSVARRRAWPAAHGSIGPLDVAAMLDVCAAVGTRKGLQAVFDEASMRWLLLRLGEKRGLGRFEAAVVRDPAGNVAGGFLYYLDPGGMASVAHLVAREGRADLVLAHLAREATAGGARALSGRGDAALVAALPPFEPLYLRRGGWVLFHSRRADVDAAVERSHGVLGRLEGEWWMSF